MMFVALDDFTRLSGLLGLIAVLIAWFYGIIVLYKAIKEKQKILYYFFFAIIFTMSPWYPSGLGYLYWLFTREIFEYSFYVLLGTIGVPFALYSWLQIYLPALHPNKKKIVTISTIIFSIVFYVYLIFFLFSAPGAPVDELIGIKRNAIDIDYKGFVLVFLAFSLLVSTITGNDFSIASLKVKDPAIRWKGRFLILSFNFFAIGAIGDGFIPLTPITLIIFRSFMLLASTFYYIGFLMPKWMKKILSLE
ncbi:MAG: hypothetical protein KAT66_08650 [Candidatus Lokiarchaeota archaeon]|nr:hypothetical protein [Candidatus Lokiarchaeota archaeon]